VLALLACAVHQFMKIALKIILLAAIITLFILSINGLSATFDHSCPSW
jgi:hypothetical protein